MADKFEKKEIDELLETFDIKDYSDFSLDNFLEKFLNWKNKYTKEGYKNFKIKTDYKYGYYDSVSVEMNLIGTRLETDKELTTRIKQSESAKIAAKNRKKAAEKAEYTRYLKLKEKFEK